VRFGIPNTLFFKTASTLVLTMVLLTTVIWGATAWFLLIPVGKQSAEDLSALLILSAQTWVELPIETKPDFKAELLQAHQIKLQAPTFELTQSNTIHPYMSRLLHKALESRIGSIASIGEDVEAQHEGWLWVDIPMGDETIRFGFPSNRIGAKPPALFITVSIAILLLTIFTAIILAQRLTRPLSKLSDATTTIGKGKKYQQLSVKGPIEISTLADNFNQMANEIHQLLENRTTLLAGISHDLRTPITRLKLALELLPQTIDKRMQQEMVGDIDKMEQLLNQTLEVARGIEHREPQQNIDISQMISQLVAPYQIDNDHIKWNPTTPIFCEISPNTFSRVFNNLMENAIRHGEHKPIEIELSDVENHVAVIIRDHGPGIPESEHEAIFRPFYRLEHSRSVTTGGSGLGLAIVQQICNAHGWGIGIKSIVGGGTEFCITMNPY